VWHRFSMNQCFDAKEGATADGKLEGKSLDVRMKSALMQLLQREVENEQRVSLASEGFGLSRQKSNRPGISSTDFRKAKMDGGNIATAAGLLNSSGAKCVFCNGPHITAQCQKVSSMTLVDRKRILSDKKACKSMQRVHKVFNLSKTPYKFNVSPVKIEPNASKSGRD